MTDCMLWQGPYKRQQIEEWHESGFFPLDLPISKSAHEPKFKTLQEVLKTWQAGGEDQAARAASGSKADSLLVQQHSIQVNMAFSS